MDTAKAKARQAKAVKAIPKQKPKRAITADRLITSSEIVLNLSPQRESLKEKAVEEEKEEVSTAVILHIILGEAGKIGKAGFQAKAKKVQENLSK